MGLETEAIIYPFPALAPSEECPNFAVCPAPCWHPRSLDQLLSHEWITIRKYINIIKGRPIC